MAKDDPDPAMVQSSPDADPGAIASPQKRRALSRYKSATSAEDDKQRQKLMDQLGITHKDLMNELSARLQAMKQKAQGTAPPEPLLNPSMQKVE